MAVATKAPVLTRRELQVLRGIVAELTYPEIAARIGLSYESVKTYATRLRVKTGRKTKTGLALWGAKRFKV